jgi:rubrerythrin
MGVRELFTGFTSGSDEGVHYECRECGRNLTRTAGVCPDCGGEVAAYEL